MDGGGTLYRGTSMDQDGRFSNKEKKLMKQMTWPPEFSTKVDIKKVDLAYIFPWVTRKVIEYLGEEDDLLINYIISALEQPGEKGIDPRALQIQLTGFLERNASKFMKELWVLLIDAQNNSNGIPTILIEEKKEEIKQQGMEVEKEVNKIANLRAFYGENKENKAAPRPWKEDTLEIEKPAEKKVEDKKEEKSPRREKEDRAEVKDRRDRDRDSRRDRERGRDKERERDRGRSGRERERERDRDRDYRDRERGRERDREREREREKERERRKEKERRRSPEKKKAKKSESSSSERSSSSESRSKSPKKKDRGQAKRKYSDEKEKRKEKEKQKRKEESSSDSDSGSSSGSDSSDDSSSSDSGDEKK